MVVFHKIVWGFCYLLSLLPFWCLYLFSDFIYLIVFDCIRYRRKVVSRNLRNSFPKKSEAELRMIEKKFYKTLCDYFMETIKMRTISEKEIKRRIVFPGIEEVDRLCEQGKSAVVYIAHSMNWEYITSLPMHLKTPGVQFGQIYHPLENPYFDKAFIDLRERFGSMSIPMAHTLRRIVDFNREKRRFVIGFLADQVPTWEAINHWVNFMHQDTPVFTGTEKIARRVGASVFYLSMSRVKRGYFKASIIKMTDDASTTEEFALTNEYFKLIEKDLEREPWLWLWTHKRWKRTREGYARREQKRAEDKRRLVEREMQKRAASEGNS